MSGTMKRSTAPKAKTPRDTLPWSKTSRNKMSWGIKKKLFLIILVILSLNVVVLLFAGSALFESLYQFSKFAELRQAAGAIKSTYQQSPSDIYNEIYSLEGKNSMTYLLSLSEDKSSINIEYSSRPQEEPGYKTNTPQLPVKGDGKWAHGGEDIWNVQRFILSQSILSDMKALTLTELKTGIHGNDRMQMLYALTKLEDNLYLYIESPKSYIKSIADLAVQYTALLSIAILLVGTVLIYFMVGRITKPIQNVQQVADRLASLDFSQRCEVRGGDEIALLAASVNNMSLQLEANILTLREANTVLQNDLERQQQIDKMRKEFIANVSHDFKTPLTLIISYAEALRDEGADEQSREYADIIIDEGNHMSSLVGRLLRLSQLESGMEQLHLDNFCVSDVLDEVVNSHKLIAQKKNLTVERAFEEPFIVRADYQKLLQVLINLFDNAVKYTPQGGRIEVSTKLSEGKCLVSVYNSGSGIPPEDIENIFLSFYRANKARTRDTQSYGLGLAIVKTIMELHQNRYGVTNVADGVVFWVELDIAELGGTTPEDEFE